MLFLYFIFNCKGVNTYMNFHVIMGHSIFDM